MAIRSHLATGALLEVAGDGAPGIGFCPALCAWLGEVTPPRRPCALWKYVKHAPPLHVETDKCRSCKACMKLGCPAISMREGKCVIDSSQCVGCGVCEELCKFSAIVK